MLIFFLPTKTNTIPITIADMLFKAQLVLFCEDDLPHIFPDERIFENADSQEINAVVGTYERAGCGGGSGSRTYMRTANHLVDKAGRQQLSLRSEDNKFETKQALRVTCNHKKHLHMRTIVQP